jgi:hypothetical protein
VKLCQRKRNTTLESLVHFLWPFFSFISSKIWCKSKNKKFKKKKNEVIFEVFHQQKVRKKKERE